PSLPLGCPAQALREKIRADQGRPPVSQGCPHIPRGCPHLSKGLPPHFQRAAPTFPKGCPQVSQGCPHISKGLPPHFQRAAPRFPKGCPPRGRPWETRGQPRRLDKCKCSPGPVLTRTQIAGAAGDELSSGQPSCQGMMVSPTLAALTASVR